MRRAFVCGFSSGAISHPILMNCCQTPSCCSNCCCSSCCSTTTVSSFWFSQIFLFLIGQRCEITRQFTRLKTPSLSLLRLLIRFLENVKRNVISVNANARQCSITTDNISNDQMHRNHCNWTLITELSIETFAKRKKNTFSNVEFESFNYKTDIKNHSFQFDGRNMSTKTGTNITYIS